MKYTAFENMARAAAAAHHQNRGNTMNKPTSYKPRNVLVATPEQIQGLEFYARRTSEGDHPTYGNFIADVLDALVVVVGIYGESNDEEYDAAEVLVEAAGVLRDQVDKRLTEAQA